MRPAVAPARAPLRPAGSRWERVWRGRVLRDRRGNAAIVVALSGTVLVGMAGLAAEGGLYYLALQDAQGSADASAMAAASAFLFRGRSAALAAGAEVAGRNGHAAADTTVSNPPASGPMSGNPYAFEVRIAKRVPVVLGRPFLGRDQASIGVRAVAFLYGTTPVCLLALSGPLTIRDSSAFRAPDCGVGSNAPGASVRIPQSNSSVVARAVSSFGTCDGCGNARWRFADGYQEQAPPVTNPYAALDSKAYTLASGASCLNTAPMEARGPIQPTGTTKAYCASVTVSNTSSVTFRPGTYVFQSTGSQVASLDIRSISSFACEGCTFVFRGNNPGNLSIGNTSSVTVTAPATNRDDADYNGVLFHRAAGGAMGSSGAPNLNLQGTSSFNLAGGIYFPGSYVRIGQVSSSSTYRCLALVGGTVEIGGLSSYSFDVSNCAEYRTGVPTTRVARLVE